MNPEPCFTDSDENRFPAENTIRAEKIDDLSDELLERCKTLDGAESVIHEHDLSETDLLRNLLFSVLNTAPGAITSQRAIQSMRRDIVVTLLDAAAAEVDSHG